MISFPQVIYNLFSRVNKPFEFQIRIDGFQMECLWNSSVISSRKPLECQVLIILLLDWQSQKPVPNSLNKQTVGPARAFGKCKAIIEAKAGNKQGGASGGVRTRVWQVTGVRDNSQCPLLRHIVPHRNPSLCISFILLSLQPGFLCSSIHMGRHDRPGWYLQLPMSPPAPSWNPLWDLVLGVLDS